MLYRTLDDPGPPARELTPEEVAGFQRDLWRLALSPAQWRMTNDVAVNPPRTVDDRERLLLAFLDAR